MSVRQPPYDFEILVKSFLRFDKLLRLVDSIRRHYPGVTVRIADDSPDSAARERAFRRLHAMSGVVVSALPTNVGLTVGRNRLVRDVRTRYFVLTDDDKVFTRQTRLERLQTVLDADSTCVLAAGMNLDYGCLLRYQHGKIEQQGRLVRRHLFGDRAPTTRIGGVECVLCDLTPNFFMANTALFHERQILWDERFRAGHGEHLSFFCRVPADLRICVVPSVRVSHFPTRWGDQAYRRFRFDPSETDKHAAVADLQVETIYVYESPWRAGRRRLESWLRHTLDRVAPAT